MSSDEEDDPPDLQDPDRMTEHHINLYLIDKHFEGVSLLHARPDLFWQRDRYTTCRSLLAWAVRTGGPQVVRFLLHHGADPNSEDWCFFGPTIRSSSSEHLLYAELLFIVLVVLKGAPTVEQGRLA